MKVKLRSMLIGIAMSSMAVAPGSASAQSSAPADARCHLTQVAFCDTFDAPSPNGIGTRSGDLDGVVWGVSRASSNDNPSQGVLDRWETASGVSCGAAATTAAPDIAICNGQLTDSVNDGGGVTVLGMYPRQPFDIAGRTGKVEFDLSADSQGPHAAWPAFVYTDQPVPAPYHTAPGLSDLARNSFGFTVDATGGQCGPGAVTVGSMFTTTNYQDLEQQFAVAGCVTKPTQHGALNRFEVRLSDSHVEVWGADPGSNDLHLMASGDFHMPLTRGLIWIEDVHYNANKFDSQGKHTFVWDNVGFDGPVLPRDLGFDVLDARQDSGSAGNLGYLVPAGGALNLNVPNVSGVERATGALLELTWTPHQAASLSYAFNGHAAHSQTWPYGDSAQFFASQTLALSVPVDELQNGTNSVSISSTDATLGGVTVANIDLILVAAGDNPAASGETSMTPSDPAQQQQEQQQQPGDSSISSP